MKIRELRLIAFGPFTDIRIDMNKGKDGMHIIYGTNEAGKSSALKALRFAFYGIHERSTDGFLHPYEKMRIGALIQRKNGDIIEFIRRKGRSNTLRAADDKTVVDESLIQQFLNGIDEDSFKTMFGIDHAELVTGGSQIITGGGSMGQVIFAAGSGVVNLREIQKDLQSEAGLLSKPSGQKPRINEVLSNLKNNRKELSAAQLPGQEWVKHDQALHKAEEHKLIVNRKLADKQRDQHHLKRIKEALPEIARRSELQEYHKNYALAVLLPDNFGDERRDLNEKLHIAENNHNQALQSIETIQKDMAKLEVYEKLLENSDIIEEIHQELGRHRKAAKDRIRLQALKDVERGEAKELLRGLRDDLTLEDAEKLRIKRTDKIKIQDLGSQFERIMTRIENAQDDIPKITDKINKYETQLKELDEPKPIDQMKITIKQTEEYGALENRCQDDQTEIQNDVKTLEIKLSKQSLWRGTFEEVEGLRVPSLETIDEFNDRIDEADRTVTKLKSENKKMLDTIAETDRQIEELKLVGDVPTEVDLQALRDMREQGWQLVRSILEGKSIAEEEVQGFIKQFQPSSILVEAFEASIHKADVIADRLRREAEHVATLAKLLAEKTTQGKQSESLEKNLKISEKKLTEITNAWIQIWWAAGITPRSPREMRGWAQDHIAMTEKAAETRERKFKTDVLQKNIDKHRNALDQCLQLLSEPLAGTDESLAVLNKRARKVLQQQEELLDSRKRFQSEKKQKEIELTEAKARVEKSERDLYEWQKQWVQAVQPFGLDAESKPSQANAVMDDIQTLFERLKEANTLQTRIKGIDRDSAEFTDQVIEVVKTVAEELANLSVDQAAIELNARLNRARKTQTKQQGLERQLSEDKARENHASKEIGEIKARFKGMCEEAGCENYENLLEAESRSEERRQIESKLKSLDEQLLGLSAGATIDHFVKEALKEDPDGIDVKIELLSEEIEELASEKSKLDQTIGEERNELSKMDGSSQAAELAEKNQMYLGQLEKDVEQYARLRIADTVLSQSIERYREKNQGPILKRGNTFFEQLTQGSFEGIRADFDNQGEPVLVGVRPGGKEIVGVKGMSDGTADQLYLALRLAGLEEYLDKNESIPFIVDDILIKFDDKRATAALQILAQLSSKTQIIFFTHHRHLVELAENCVDPSVLVMHTLNENKGYS